MELILVAVQFEKSHRAVIERVDFQTADCLEGVENADPVMGNSRMCNLASIKLH
jgi:hypothetical protein